MEEHLPQDEAEHEHDLPQEDNLPQAEEEYDLAAKQLNDGYAYYSQVPDGLLPATSQMRAAMIMASVASDKFRFVTGTAAGWHFWDGQRWQPDPGFYVRQEMSHVVNDLLSKLAVAKLVPVSTFAEMQRNAAQEGALKIAASMQEFAITHDQAAIIQRRCGQQTV